MILYDFYRSSASYRVRIALALKGLQVERRHVHLLRAGGEQRQAAYVELNPQQMVPTLVTDDGRVLTQSLAIIEYLESVYPQTPVLPAHPADQAWVRSIAYIIAGDIQPLVGLRTQRYLREQGDWDDNRLSPWRAEWITQGLESVEALASRHGGRGRYLHGDTPSLADIVAVPFVVSVRASGIDTKSFPTLDAAIDQALAHPAFRQAAPEQQPDYEAAA